MIFRIRWKVLGGHTHCRLFAGLNDAALGKCGDLVMRNDEFEIFKHNAKFIQFMPDTDYHDARDLT